MDRQIEAPRTKQDAKRPYHSGHLMCRTSLWGIAGFLGCAYFAWISFSRVRQEELEWPHDAWTAATYVVWIVLLAALAIDTRCLRERVFFWVLVLNFVIGFSLTVWASVPSSAVRTARVATGELWILGALVSLTTIGRSRLVGSAEK